VKKVVEPSYYSWLTKIPSFLRKLCDKEENVKVRQIIIPFPQFDTLFSLAEAKSKEKTNKNLPIKDIVTTHLFEEKLQSIIIKKTNEKLKKKLN
jgi:hypothetical protein